MVQFSWSGLHDGGMEFIDDIIVGLRLQQNDLYILVFRHHEDLCVEFDLRYRCSAEMVARRCESIVDAFFCRFAARSVPFNASTEWAEKVRIPSLLL